MVDTNRLLPLTAACGDWGSMTRAESLLHLNCTNQPLDGASPQFGAFTPELGKHLPVSLLLRQRVTPP